MWGCDPFYVSFLTDRRLYLIRKHDFVHICSTKGALLLHVTYDIKRRTQKFDHHILCYVSKVQRSERDNEFFVSKKTS